MKKLLTLGGTFVGIGLVLLFIVHLMTGGQYNRVSGSSTQKHETFSSQAIKNLDVDVDTIDVHIIGSDQDEVTVDYTEKKENNYTISNQNGNLSIRQKAHFHFAFFDIEGILEALSGHPSYQISINVPKKLLHKVKIAADAGDISLQNLDINSSLELDNRSGQLRLEDIRVQQELQASLSTGDLSLSQVTAGNVTLQAASGDISLKHVTALGNFQAKLSTGDLHLDYLDVQKDSNFSLSAGNLSGSIKGTMSDFNFDTKTTLGSSNLPNSQTGGKKNLTAKVTTGDIHLQFVN